MGRRHAERQCTVVLHDDRTSEEDVLAGPGIMQVGEIAYLDASRAETLCIKPSDVAANTDEISLHKSLAERFGYMNRTPGIIRILENVETATADHVGFSFRDQLLSRADIWQIMFDIDGCVIYRGQNIPYLGSSCAEVQHVYIGGSEVDSAYIAHPKTKPIFRSSTAHYTILIELSKELLEKWYHGDLMYERLIDGFLPDLFDRWTSLRVRHVVTVILYGHFAGKPGDGIGTPSRSGDFYHTVASDTTSTQWLQVLRSLKHVFNNLLFPQNVSRGSESNMLSAIHLVAQDYGDDQEHLTPTSSGNSILAITASTDPMTTSYSLLRQVTQLLTGNSVGVDIVSLAAKPPQPAPLFKYECDGAIEYALPHWVDISFWEGDHDIKSATGLQTELGPANRVALPILNCAGSHLIDEAQLLTYDNDTFRTVDTEDFQKQKPAVSKARTATKGQDGRITPSEQRKETFDSTNSQAQPSVVASTKSTSTQRIKKDKVPPHHLMRTGRKISLGPHGIAPMRGSVSTTLSVAHAQHDRDPVSTDHASSASHAPGSLAKAIRASLTRKGSQQSLISNRTTETDEGQASEPIEILTRTDKPANNAHDPTSSIEKRIAETLIGGAFEQHDAKSDRPKTNSDMAKGGELLEVDRPNIDKPWLLLKNPCHPRRQNMQIAGQFRKWQHVFPHMIMADSFKWASMTSPAMLPITTEYRPSPVELENYYTKHVRRHVISHSPGLQDESARVLMERLIRLRLLHGFQIVAIPHSGSDFMAHLAEKPILLAHGHHYHEVQGLSDFEAQVVIYEPKASEEKPSSNSMHQQGNVYSAHLRTFDGTSLQPSMRWSSKSTMLNWHQLDEYVLGLLPVIGSASLFRIRLVLVPVSPSKSDYTIPSRLRDLAPDERCIEGIQKLTQMWQRQRHFSGEDRQNQVSLVRSKSSTNVVERDPNPLSIEYHTREPSVIVNAHGAMLSSRLDDTERPIPLFSDAEKHHSSTFDISKLVKQMQEQPPLGVDMRDRRWLTQTHPKCFRGDEMTTWLLGVFKDVKTREHAVAVGNELMDRGLFTHVHDKHRFRDGHYFYQIASHHRTTNYPDTLSLFSKAPWRSTPATPMAEIITSPDVRPQSGDSIPSAAATPILGPSRPKEVMLSQMLQYNVDPSKKSGHLQVIDIHYDRIHNPDNCYHIQLEWLGASMKLTRESIARWTSLVEPYGLKLIQLPLEEASKCSEQRPLDQIIPVKLTVKPPDHTPATPLIAPYSFSPREKHDELAFHKALLRHQDFVLDYEAARAFRTKERISYSWGAPTYKYTQFVHRSGQVIAQIAADEHADFLLLPNRLAASRLPSSSKHVETEGPYDIIRTFKAFCRDGKALVQVYDELERPRAQKASPAMADASITDIDVPPMQLPPHVMQRSHGSAFWNRRPG